jgi:predicted trehalose synthase
MIAQLVRRLEAGTNPGVEIPRHLGRIGLAHALRLVASFDASSARRRSATS